MSTALKKTPYYSPLNCAMQRLENTGQNLVTQQLQISGQADAECSPDQPFWDGRVTDSIRLTVATSDALLFWPDVLIFSPNS